MTDVLDVTRSGTLRINAISARLPMRIFAR
jgi:hypothetical protein